jgi:hypothetical protein
MPPLKSVNIVKLPQWRYLGGITITANGTSQAVALPSDASTFVIAARGGDVHFNINGPVVVTSPGFVAENGSDVFGPISNLESLYVYGAVGAYAHIMFFAEIAR